MADSGDYRVVNGPDGPINFPGSMSDAEVEAAMGKLYPKPSAETELAKQGIRLTNPNPQPQLPGPGLAAEALQFPRAVAQSWNLPQTAGLYRSAQEDLWRGDVNAGRAKELNAVLNLAFPGLGERSQQAGEALARGDYGQGLTGTLKAGGEALVDALIGRLGPQGIAEMITPGVEGPVGRFMKQFRLTDPANAVTRALGTISSNPQFSGRIPQVLSRIIEGNEGQVPQKITDVVPAAQRALDMHNDALQAWMDRKQGLPVSGEPVIEATRDAVRGMLPTEQATTGRGLIERAQRDYGAGFTPETLQDRLELLNKRIEPFYEKQPSKQSAALADIPEAVLKAQRDAAANTLYSFLDPENAGANPRAIQRARGDLIQFRNAVESQQEGIKAQEPLTAFGRAVDPLVRPIKQAIGSVVTPSKQLTSSLIGQDVRTGRSFPLLKQAFEAASGQPVYPLGLPPAPIPLGPARQLPAATSQIGVSGVTVPDILGRPDPMTHRMLAPPPQPSIPTSGRTYVTPPPPDTSFVRGVPLAPHQIVMTEPKLLSPGTAPFGVSGTMVPDLSGQIQQGIRQLGQFPQLEAPPQPAVPTLGHPILTPPPEIPSIPETPMQAPRAKPGMYLNPRTGRWSRYFTSESEK